ncbi:non-ribosomal peptide synthetase [Streptomyces atratus]|uniref:Amino acid adenylation domain-containing protein n=1 Tax=Streptomyces atratus TaxID=1893 RepID=A0A1K1ZTX4_STRAR|nr:non-ribosomal peptide synthetase [Streptomyces atratus]SFX77609.1 amino acid adenylation domain-containing protein [Streptomyces atratus]
MNHPECHEPGLPELVARQARLTPDALAVESAGGGLTYRELDRAANRLAHELRARGVRRDEVVAVCLPRRPRLAVALLGVLRAGAAFMPLDPAHPSRRLAWMLRDARARLLLVDAEAPVVLPEVPVLPLAGHAAIDARPATPVEGATDPDGLAYVMYTSGSTGRPKGVAVVHRGILNRVRWAVGRYAFTAADRVLQKTSVTFDASVWEFFGPLVTGGTVVLAPDGAERDPALTVEVLARERITVLQGVPTFLRTLAEEPGLDGCTSLRLLFSAGEPLTDELAVRLTTRLPALLVNTYGPTECSIDVTSWEFDGPGTGAVPIGLPLDGTRAEVLAPDGSRARTGELRVAGAGLARGYLGNPRLTADRFVPDPYGPPGARAYRTGDRVHRRKDGVLEFTGRMDHQVKIRGIRVEPGEVEVVLARHPAVAAAVVVPRPGPDGQPWLVGYVVPRAEPPAHRDLRAYLLDRLPEAYVPSLFVPLDGLPLSSSGKTDRAALPAPSGTRGTGGPAPATPEEKLVADLMADVLGLETIGADDDFFDLGGHSLLAIRVAGKLRAALGVPVSVRTVFEARTVAALAERVAHLGEEETADHIEVLDPQERSGPARLSFTQQRLWFLDRLNPGSPEYRVSWGFRLRGPLDTDALGSAVRDLVARHEILRTRYVTGPEGAPGQTVAPAGPFPLPVTALTGEERERDVRQLIRSLAEQPFDLSAGAPFAPRLIRIGAHDHVFVVLMHHILTDDWTEDVLARELSELYRSHAAGQPAALEPLRVQYVDYAAWQRGQLSGPALDADLSYWRERLSGMRPLDLPTDRPRPAVRDGVGGVVRETLSSAEAQPLLRLGRERGATSFMTLLSVFYTLLGRYTGASDLAVGTVVAGRGHPEIEDVAGCFVNTLVLRVDLSDDPTPERLISRVRDHALDAFGHDRLPFDRLVDELAPQRDLSRSPLVDVTFGVRESPSRPLTLAGVDVQPFETDHTGAKFDLTVLLTAQPDGGYRMELEYATELFTEATVRRIAHHFRALATAMGSGARRPLSRLPMLDRPERERLLHGWNPPRTPVEPECAHEAFAAQAARTPEAVAVTGDGEQLSYAELAVRADALARRLVAAGTRLESPVAVVLDRSTASVTALLAVLRAGGVFAPLDLAQPAERLAAMLDELRPSAVLTDAKALSRLGELPAPAVLVDAPNQAPPVELSPGDPGRLAYVVHTSGSTGRPKAVMITHEAFTHHARVMAARLGYRSDDRVLFLAPPHFDPALEQMLAPLLLGATVVVGDPGPVSPAELPALITRTGVTQLAVVPHLYREVAAAVTHRGVRPTTLRNVVVAGDVVTLEDARRWFATGLDARFVTLYGATEATVAALTQQVGEADLATGGLDRSVPLGQPLPGARVYVLDERMQPVPTGVAGEVHLGGVRLARGYLRQPRATADRFVPDPYGDEPGERLYRTGDLARRRADGALEFLGRTDAQVKIRGFRVELGEIEAALARHPAVRAAAVAMRSAPGGDRWLIGYVVPHPDAPDVTGADLRAHLRDRLPEYMVPAAFVRLGELPLGASEKVDRKALPPPGPQAEEERFTAPRDEVEEAVAEAWAAVLGIERVGVDQEFFDLGGHSLLATRLATRLRDLFGMDIPLRLLFEATTVAAQTDALARLAEADSAPAHADPAVTRS